MTSVMGAEFTSRLLELQSDAEREKLLRCFRTGDGDHAEHDTFVGVRMGEVFRLAKGFIDLPCTQIEALLDSPIHEVRAGALSIMDKQAPRRTTSEEQRREPYELYPRRHDRIHSWDLVDLAAPWVIGHYLLDRTRYVLDRLAHSEVNRAMRTGSKRLRGRSEVPSSASAAMR